MFFWLPCVLAGRIPNPLDSKKLFPIFDLCFCYIVHLIKTLFAHISAKQG